MKHRAPRPGGGRAGRQSRGVQGARAIFLSAAVVIAGMSAHAAELVVDTALSGRIEYNDNAALRLEPAPSWRFLVDPSISLSRKTESSQVSARLRMGFNRYTNPTVPDSTDKALTLSATQLLERSRVGLVVGYSDLSSQSIQVLGQTGINVGLRRVESFTVAPTWTYSVSSLLSLNASAGYSDTRFEQTSPVQVTDYRTTNASLGFTRAVGERLSIGLSGTYLTFDTSPFVSRSETWSTNATVTYAFSPTLKGAATVGIQRVKTSQALVVSVCPVEPIFCQLGIVQPVLQGVVGESVQQLIPYNVSLDWRLSERSTFAATFLQRVNPSGLGVLTSASQASASFNHALSPTTDFSLTLGYIRSRSLGGTALSELASLAPTLTWRLSEAWVATAGYAFTRLDYSNVGSYVDANVVFVSVTYGWPQWTQRY